MAYKCSLFFKDQDESAGWSETYYRLDSSAGDALASTRALARARKDVLGRDVTLDYVRVSDEAVYRDSLVAQFNPGLVVDPTLFPGNAAPPWTSILCRVEAGIGQRRPLYLRGAPQSVCSEPENIGGFAPWNGAMNAFVGSLTDGTWFVKCMDHAQPAFKILDITPGVGPAAPSLVVEPIFPGLPALSQLRVGKVNAVRPFNGVYTILSAPVGGPIILQGQKNPVYLTPPGAYNFKGYVRAMVPTYKAINRVVVERLVTRRTGRPFDLLHGRRSVRRT